jgi:hypothetical protein
MKFDNTTIDGLDSTGSQLTILKVWSKTEKEWEKISHWVVVDTTQTCFQVG